MSGYRGILPTSAHGNVEVARQDQFTDILSLDFIQQQGAPTFLNTTAVPDDETIDLVSVTGFVDGSFLGIFTGTGLFYFGGQIGAPAGNIITLDTPIDNILPSGSTVLRLSRDMNVDGSVTTQIFQIGPIGGSGIEVDITRVMGTFVTTTEGDDSNFGDLAALTRGLVLRKNNGIMKNIWNVKTNGRIGLITFNFEYVDRAPAGKFASRYRNSFAGEDKHGVTVRLAGSDILQILVQDDLRGLDSFGMMAQGHIVEF